jgi:class 3 adenylate cyclase
MPRSDEAPQTIVPIAEVGDGGQRTVEPLSGTVTFLFTDIEGSTRLSEEHPQAMSQALARHDTILVDAVESSGGHVVKTTGDGLFAVFRRAESALTAALAAKRLLAGAAWDPSCELRVRMGLGRLDGVLQGPAERRTHRELRRGSSWAARTSKRARRDAGHGGAARRRPP